MANDRLDGDDEMDGNYLKEKGEQNVIVDL